MVNVGKLLMTLTVIFIACVIAVLHARVVCHRM
jgi:hypothetical protein